MLERIIDTQGFNSLVKGKYGYVLYNKNDQYIGKAIEKYGEFSELEVELFRQICKPGDVVVEVGTNIGTHTMVLSQLVGEKGKVYAFEPQRIIYQTLCANMALNSITNVECFQAAVSSKEGHVLIPDIQYDKEGNFGGIDVNQFNHGTKVPMVTLDHFLDLSRLNLLKVDVEGMELEVLSGARNIVKTFKPALYVENDRVEKSKELIEFIRSLNYRMFWHFPALYNPKNVASDSENIFSNIVSFNMLCFHNSYSLNLQGLQEITDSELHPLKK